MTGRVAEFRDWINERSTLVLDYDSSAGVSEMLMNRLEMQNSLPLYRSNGIPLYHQIQQRLLDQIQSGAFKPNEPIPSIQKIASQMGVSQMTVRQAVKSLCELGVIYSRQGKGTFISRIKLERDFARCSPSARRPGPGARHLIQSSSPSGSRCPTGRHAKPWPEP